MPRGEAPLWKQPAEHTAEAAPHVHAAYLRGFELEHVLGPIESRERAATVKRGLFNAARRHDPPVSVSTKIEPAGPGQFQIRFTLHDKRVAKAYIVGKHGTDRNAWPYNPRKRG